MRIKNVSPLGDLHVPGLLGVQVVKAGQVIDVPDQFAVSLLEQPTNWVRENEEKVSAK